MVTTEFRYTRTAAVLAYLRRHIAEHGTPPSIRDIVRGLGLPATGSVTPHLRILREAGLVSWEAGKARTLRLTGKEAG